MVMFLQMSMGELVNVNSIVVMIEMSIGAANGRGQRVITSIVDVRTIVELLCCHLHFSFYRLKQYSLSFKACSSYKTIRAASGIIHLYAATSSDIGLVPVFSN